MLKRLLQAAMPLAFLALFAGAALAQAPSAQPVYNVGRTITYTETALAAGAKNETDAFNPGWRAIVCFVNQTAHTGSAGITLGIANKDPGAAAYTTLLTSATYTTDAEQVPIFVFPGAPVSANVSASAVLSSTQRIIITVGSASTFTGKVSCTWN